MNFIKAAVAQPVTIAVAVILSLIAGMVALKNVPIRMAPEVDSVVISVGTAWENASAEEIESDVIEQQEKFLSAVKMACRIAKIFNEHGVRKYGVIRIDSTEFGVEKWREDPGAGTARKVRHLLMELTCASGSRSRSNYDHKGTPVLRKGNRRFFEDSLAIRRSYKMHAAQGSQGPFRSADTGSHRHRARWAPSRSVLRSSPPAPSTRRNASA